MGDTVPRTNEGPASSHLHKFPFQFRVGAVGLGFGMGCGAGLGFGSPLDLRGIPGVGQVVASLGNGLRSMNGATGGLGSQVRLQVRRLGVKGLDIGFGCGVGLGYGIGLGLMLRPEVLDHVSRDLQTKLGGLLSRLPGPFHQERRPFPPELSNLLSDRNSLSLSRSSPASLKATFPSSPLSNIEPISQEPLSTDFGATVPTGGPGAGDPRFREVYIALREMAGILREIHSLMHDISSLTAMNSRGILMLEEENLQLKEALCKLDGSAPFCKVPRGGAGKDSGTGGGSGEH